MGGERREGGREREVRREGRGREGGREGGECLRLEPVQMWNRPGFVCKSQSMPASVSFHKLGHYPARIGPGDPQIIDTSTWKVYETVNKWGTDIHTKQGSCV